MAKRQERLAYWRALVREHAASGLTQVAFCAAKKVSPKSFQRWRSKLLAADGLALTPAVVEVVVEEPVGFPVAPPSAARDVELLAGGDLSLFIPPGTAPDYVADLVAALRERGAC